MNEQQAFIDALKTNEDDTTTRMVYADWLDENDEPEEANRMRRWTASKAWMLDWVRSINYGAWEYDDEGEDILDANGERVPAKKDNLGDPHTLEDAIEAGHIAVRGETYCWGSDAGQDYFFNKDWTGVECAKVREWFHHWSIVTGESVPNLEKVVEQPPFRCAC